jgi:hypothetical protein
MKPKERIEIVYWHGVELMEKYGHRQSFKFSVRKLHHIIDEIIRAELNVMVVSNMDDTDSIPTTYVWIDNGRFRQR